MGRSGDGHRRTSQEVKRLSKMEQNQEIAAAKAGMDAKTARKYLREGRLPSEARLDRTWRTRPDPFTEVWEEVRQLVEANPGLEAKTLFEALQREHQGRFADGQLRTLQRRLKHWRARRGEAGRYSSLRSMCQDDWGSPTSRT